MCALFKERAELSDPCVHNVGVLAQARSEYGPKPLAAGISWQLAPDADETVLIRPAMLQGTSGTGSIGGEDMGAGGNQIPIVKA